MNDTQYEQPVRKVLVSGAGIAGPALAMELSRLGIACTVVERASSLRTGGQAVDFRGPIHREVLTRTGLWDPIHEARTTPGDLVLLDRVGKPAACLPAVMTAGDVEILRGDLSRLLYDRSCDRAEYRFGDRIAALRNVTNGVDVDFASGRTERFDLVVGADGLHSGVRALAFGAESDFVKRHGYRIASFAVPDAFGLDRGSMLFSTPGHGVCITTDGRGSNRALLVDVSTEENLRDLEAQRASVIASFRGIPWVVPHVVDALVTADDLYVDEIATVHVPNYSRGRVVLLGDAAWGGTLGGQGTSLGIVGAHVLAGELAKTSNVSDALARYETRMRPYATGCQKGAMRAGSFFAPKSKAAIAARNLFHRLLTTPAIIGVFEWLVKEAANDFVLPDYSNPTAA